MADIEALAENLYIAAKAWYDQEREIAMSFLGYVPTADPGSCAFELGTALQAYREATGKDG